MKANVTKEQLTQQLVKVLSNKAENAVYNTDAEQYAMCCGWCGNMSPVSRPAYVVEFGAAMLEEAEQAARDIIAADAKKYEASEFHACEVAADGHLYANQPAPAEGSYIWAMGSGMKCDNGRGIYCELRNMLDFFPANENPRETLVKVERVYNVSTEEFADPATADRLAARQDCPGGWCEDDNKADYLHGDNMFYIIAAAVVSPNGRYYLIDNEGGSYARHILLPLAWRQDFADFITEIEEAERRKEEEEQRAAAAAKAARLAAYNRRCEKWADIMEAVAPYEEAEKNAPCGSSEYKAARRKLNSVRRANILAMCRAAFPGVKFSLKKCDGWGADWLLSWTDGPTEAAFRAATDLALFETYHDTFDGMTDCAGIAHAEFSDFARRYMGASANAVSIERKESNEARNEILQRVFAVVPECEKKTARGYYDYFKFTADQAVKLAEAFSLDTSEMFHGNYNRMPETVAHLIWTVTDYTAEAPTEANKPEAVEVTAAKTEEPAEVAEDTTAAPSLRLIDYSERAFALIGDTKKIREKLKSMGGRFNARLSCGAGWVFSKKHEAEIRKAFAI